MTGGGLSMGSTSNQSPERSNGVRETKLVTDVDDSVLEELGKSSAAESDHLRSRWAAIDRVQAVIEFQLDGTIVSANDNFLNAVGYSLADIQGKHHSMFVDEETKNRPNTVIFGVDSLQVLWILDSTSAMERMGEKYGSKRLTILFSAHPGSLSESSSLPPISLQRSCKWQTW